jgi:phosphate transport system substrate-binding protein
MSLLSRLFPARRSCLKLLVSLPAACVVTFAVSAAPLAIDPLVPAYHPKYVDLPKDERYVLPDGTIRIVGTNTMETILRGFNERFTQTHPGFKFSMQLKKGLMAIGAITHGVTPFAPVPREFTAMEADPFTKIVGQAPMAIRIGYGSVISQTRTASLAIYVNRANPIEKLTVEQVARIFTTGHPKGDITHWGQLGLKGEWARRRILPYGTPEDSGFGSFMLMHKMEDRPFSPGHVERPISVDILRLVGTDAGGIAFCATNFATPQTKLVAIADREDGFYSAGSADDVVNDRYPYRRFIYLYLRRLPGEPLEPWLKEYLRMVLSQDGQKIIASETDGFLPLGAPEIAAELAKINGD